MASIGEHGSHLCFMIMSFGPALLQNHDMLIVEEIVLGWPAVFFVFCLCPVFWCSLWTLGTRILQRVQKIFFSSVVIFQIN